MLLIFLIPLLGTLIGSSFIFFKSFSKYFLGNFFTGLCVGVMMASAIFSLLVPALNLSKMVLEVIIGFSLGILFFDLFNKVININNTALAVCIHNIPEGMCVGVLTLGTSSSFLSLIALSISIAIQNIPEGVIVAWSMQKKGKIKAFFWGVFSALLELLGTVLALQFACFGSFLPVILSFAAACMFYSCLTDVIPTSFGKNNLAIIGFLIGFILILFLENLF